MNKALHNRKKVSPDGSATYKNLIWERWQQNNLGSNGRFPAASGIPPHCTAISHDDVCYLEQYRSLSRQEVDDSIMPLLMAEESQPFGTSAKKEKVSKQKK